MPGNTSPLSLDMTEQVANNLVLEGTKLKPEKSPAAIPDQTLARGGATSYHGHLQRGLTQIASKEPCKGNKKLRVTAYTESDFGFHAERLRETVGMSQMKVIRNETARNRDLETIAEKHIHALQTESMSSRGSRTKENVQNLKDLLTSGSMYNKDFAPRTRLTSRGKDVLGRPSTKSQRIVALRPVVGKGEGHIEIVGKDFGGKTAAMIT